MTSRHAREAEQFAQHLDQAGKAVPVVAALGALGAALRTPRPAPAFQTALRARLVAQATQLAATAPAAAPSAAAAHAAKAAGHVGRVAGKGTWLSSPLMTVATGGMAVAVAASGVGLATARAKPGDLLYGLKRTVNGAPSTASHTATKGIAHLEDAGTRVAELAALVKGTLAAPGSAAFRQLEQTLALLDQQTAAGIDALLSAARAGSVAATQRFAQLTAKEQAALRTLLPSLPAQLRPAAVGTLTRLSTARALLPRLPGTHTVPGGTPSTPTPGETTPAPHVTTPGGKPTVVPTVPVPTVPAPPVTVPTLPVPLPTPTDLLPTIKRIIPLHL